MNVRFKILLLSAALCLLTLHVNAQEKLVQNYNQLMNIPSIIAMEASAAHLYVLSEDEGMAVFRAYPDSLQWLYTSSGMQRRGDRIMADIRFAYLFGDTRRLTVLEPTSVLGVYSSTMLPSIPKAAARLGNNLYVALGRNGIGMVSLETPETVDSDIQSVAKTHLNGNSVLDIRAIDISKQLFVLTNAPSLLIFEKTDNDLSLSREISLNVPLEHIFIDEEQVWGSTQNGEIYAIRSTGIGRKIGITNESIERIYIWNDRITVRTKSGRIWVTDEDRMLGLWKDDTAAGNYIANNQQSLWISENDKVTEVQLWNTAEVDSVVNTDLFKISEIQNQIVTYPSPLMLALDMQGDYPDGQVEFSYRSNVKNAKIRKQGFYWRPTVNQMGNHWFTIIATSSEGKTDSTNFVVDVRSFNSPPRFSPVRATSIAVLEKYEIQFNATDPENPQNSLVRYIGVDLPDGAKLNEKTGVFSWTPSSRQVGESTFKVIATDRLGAAASIDVTLKVLDISRNGSDS